MGSNDEFGPDTETIRAWLAKRATYARDARVISAPRGGTAPAGTPAAQVVSEATADAVRTVPEPGAAARTGPASRPDGNSAGRSVLAALEEDGTTTVTPGPVAAVAPVAPTGPAGPADSTEAGRSVVEALRVPQPPPAPRPPAPRRSPRRTTRRTTGVATPTGTSRVGTPRRASAGAPEPAPTPGPRPETAAREGASRWTEPEENLAALEASTDVDFPVRGGVRRLLSAVLIVFLAATGAASYVAVQSRTPTVIAVAGLLGFLALMTWAVRAGCTTTELSIHRGQLSIRRSGRTEVVDLSSHFTPIAIVGEPGHRRWTVLIERPGLPLAVIDRRMVDAHWFTSALYRVRPELRPGRPDDAHGEARTAGPDPS